MKKYHRDFRNFQKQLDTHIIDGNMWLTQAKSFLYLTKGDQSHCLNQLIQWNSELEGVLRNINNNDLNQEKNRENGIN